MKFKNQIYLLEKSSCTWILQSWNQLVCFFHYIGASWSNDVIFHQIPQLLMSYKWQNISSWHSHESYSCSLLCKSQMQQEPFIGIKCLKVFSQMQHECHQDTQFFFNFFLSSTIFLKYYFHSFSILPEKATYLLLEFLGAHNAMNTFVGREKKIG